MHEDSAEPLSPSTMLWEGALVKEKCAQRAGDRAEERIFNSVWASEVIHSHSRDTVFSVCVCVCVRVCVCVCVPHPPPSSQTLTHTHSHSKSCYVTEKKKKKKKIFKSGGALFFFFFFFSVVAVV